MITTIEKSAKILLDQHKDQEGKFTSWLEAKVSYHKKLHYYFKSYVGNMFNEVPEDLLTLQKEVEELRLKEKDNQFNIVLLTQQKKQLQGTCITLQEEIKRLKKSKK
jgi:hypothetical protein